MVTIAATKTPYKNHLEETRFVFAHGFRGLVSGQPSPLPGTPGEAASTSRRKGAVEVRCSTFGGGEEERVRKMPPSRTHPQDWPPPATHT